MSADEALAQMNKLLALFPLVPTSDDPAELLPGFFLGSVDHAREVRLLKALGIKCVINCAETETGTDHYKALGDAGIKCVGFSSSDERSYPILDHLPLVRAEIDSALSRGEKCLLHCMAGVNRSGALAIAYITERTKAPLIEVARSAKEKRGRICTNVGFQSQLVKAAVECKWKLL